jgi:hypothetical protein
MFANGFLLPEREIQPTAEETWEAVKIVAQEVLDEIERLRQKRKPLSVYNQSSNFSTYESNPSLHNHSNNYNNR